MRIAGFSKKMHSTMRDRIFHFGMGLLAASAILALLQFLSCCTTVRYVGVVRDSVRIVNNIDTVLVRDSVFTHEYTKGDTVYIVRDKTKIVYKYVGRTDTAYVTRRDSVAYPVERKTVEHKYQTAWYDRVCRLVSALCALVVAGWMVVRYVRKRL